MLCVSCFRMQSPVQRCSRRRSVFDGRCCGRGSDSDRNWRISGLRRRQGRAVLRAADRDLRRAAVPGDGAFAAGTDRRRTQAGASADVVQQRRRELLSGTAASS